MLECRQRAVGRQPSPLLLVASLCWCFAACTSAAKYASLGEGACAVNSTDVKQCLYFFSDSSEETCKQACNDAPRSGDEYCIGFSSSHSTATNTTQCYLYGYVTSCPEVDGDAGFLAPFGSTDFAHINNVYAVSGLPGFECVLKRSFVEEHGIAFTSIDGEEKALCLGASSSFCDTYACYDCGCISDAHGLAGAERVCASSLDRAESSIPATSLMTEDNCTIACTNMDGVTLDPIPQLATEFVNLGPGLCAVPGATGNPRVVQSCDYATVESQAECEALCVAASESEEAYLWGVSCHAYYYISEGLIKQCMLYGLDSYCPIISGYHGVLLPGTTRYEDISITEGEACTVAGCVETGCMITKQFAEEYITDFSGKIGGAVVAALLSLAALAGAIFWIIRQPPKLDVAGDDFAKDFYFNRQDSFMGSQGL